MNYSKLKFDLERAEISIRELCRRINITHAGLYRSIKLQTINLNTFEKICKELKLNPNDYFELGIELPAKPDTFLEKLEKAENLIKELKAEILSLKEK